LFRPASVEPTRNDTDGRSPRHHSGMVWMAPIMTGTSASTAGGRTSTDYGWVGVVTPIGIMLAEADSAGDGFNRGQRPAKILAGPSDGQHIRSCRNATSVRWKSWTGPAARSPMIRQAQGHELSSAAVPISRFGVLASRRFASWTSRTAYTGTLSYHRQTRA